MVRRDLQSLNDCALYEREAGLDAGSDAVPPTQQAIADLLDRKTAAIDALIERKQKILDLLAEKRTALINRAVTKGLDPSVPMKDSGVPWIGEIPEHWEKLSLRRVCRVQQGLQIPRSDRLTSPTSSAVEYITVRSIHAGGDAVREWVSGVSNRVIVHPSEILVSRTGATGAVFAGVSGAFHTTSSR